jgi:predicted nuclease of predicted toxin-antitoxin system
MKVRLFADECVAYSTIRRLRAAGFDIVAAADVCPSVDDAQVLAAANNDGRVLLTADKDFGELVVRFGHETRGVVNLALGDLPAVARARIAEARLNELGDRILGNLVTIEPGRVRIRPLRSSGD